MSRPYDIVGLKAALEGLRLEDNPALVKQKSRDFFWYSPILKSQLDAVVGDLVVTPRNTAEVVRIVEACHRLGIPVTPRGSGTGNYGQAMPLSGGVVLNMAEMRDITQIGPGRVVCGPGAIMAEIDAATRAHSGQELRMHPSTYATASIGGFLAGGSGGVGSINWGGLRDLGNVLSVEVVTMEASPRVLRLTGADLAKVMHAYGTNGIITEVEMPLTAAYDWVDIIVGFRDFAAAARFGNALGEQDGILTKLITPIAAPVPQRYFLRHRALVPDGASVVLVMLAPHARDAFALFCKRFGGAEILFDAGAVPTVDRAGLPSNVELSWNHTTLRALRVDPAITYLQVLYPFPDQLALVDAIHKRFPDDEVMGHLEFVRFDGRITCFGLPLIRFTDAARLNAIIRIHEDMGAPIFNPHRYTLEEGGMKQTDDVQLAFKREADPQGLLNPGKMVAWDNPDFDFASGKTYLYPSLEPSRA
ncbi:FAD-binding oxidoreductase [Lichenihabitans sp. Uapishka_5]|uniref:FAD-binding oxidoreductase n=1 Tax=Lichenihabitans sp. Uapishka_5 TaxID=3037302 RepID=UPI0029E7D878|nr:FAD-binding oxidoreductase [Lichenihabitans sp. Uapishka_5]MDX7949981.1 FAD-binding oxidoreductase [Lichenihabitans sp. Uapishka_5]